MSESKKDYSLLHALRGQTPIEIRGWGAAEGVRLGLISCPECGAALLIDGREERDAIASHAVWHSVQRLASLVK